jgi:hypothetical protein
VDHREIEERDIAFLYLKGQLSADEYRLFEEHFVDCSECLDRIEILQGLRSGLRQAAVEDASQERAPALAGWAGWLARWQAWQQAAALACAVLLLVAMPAWLLLARMGSLRRELSQARQTATQWQDRYNQERQTSAGLQQPFQGEKLAAAAIFPLVTSRSADVSSTVNHITITRSSALIVLSLEREYEPGFQSYRVTLKDPAGTSPWQASDLVPSSPTTLAIVLPSRLVQEGNYLLTIEGLKPDGRYVVAAHYAFQVSIRH